MEKGIRKEYKKDKVMKNQKELIKEKDKKGNQKERKLKVIKKEYKKE